MIPANHDESIPQSGEVDRIHILHIVTSLEPGGLENGVVNLANLLDPERFRTSILCLERIGEFANRLDKRTSLECLHKPDGFRPSAVLGLSRILSRTRPDIIHTHNLGPLIYGTLANLARGNSAVILQGEHAQLRPDEKTRKRLIIRKLCYRSCAMIHAVSEGLRQDLIASGFPENKIQTILNGVDCETFSPADAQTRGLLRSRHGIPADGIVIGIVGRFGTFKRHSKLIAGFERVAGDHPGLYLLMVGDHGPEKERVLNQVAASPFRNRIVWCGYQEQPADFYRMMDLLMVPSVNEGLSNAILEAMASGVACVAHPACGANEVIIDGANGMLRLMENEQELASVIREAISCPSHLHEMGLQAREDAGKQFSIASMVSGYSGVYQNICASNPKN